MFRRIGLFLLFLCSTVHAEDYSFIWCTYAQWQRLSLETRMYYLGGAFDSLTGFAADEKQKNVSVHYSKCMHDSGMSLKQFTDHVAAYAEMHPQLQGTTMQGVMINYLIELCGQPRL